MSTTIMFRGRSKHALDDKGRLAIPARFKEVLKQKQNDCLVLTNHDKCLWAFAQEDWRIIEERAANMPKLDPMVNSFYRYFISGAQECPSNPDHHSSGFEGSFGPEERGGPRGRLAAL